MSRETPWAVLMCKFKDDQRGFVTINRQDAEAMFKAPDIENVVTFWRDVSYGEVDLSGSKTFGWLTLDQKQQDFNDALATLGNDKARSAMFSWALKAASDAEIKLDSFYGVTVYMSTPTDLWGGYKMVPAKLCATSRLVFPRFSRSTDTATGSNTPGR